MERNTLQSLRENYDQLSDEYARRLFNELEGKPLDCELLDRFAADTAGRGKVCDMGCGPGQVARYLRGRGADVCGLDLSPGMVRAAQMLNPEIPFLAADMSALCLGDRTHFFKPRPSASIWKMLASACDR